MNMPVAHLQCLSWGGGCTLAGPAVITFFYLGPSSCNKIKSQCYAEVFCMFSGQFLYS